MLHRQLVYTIQKDAREQWHASSDKPLHLISMSLSPAHQNTVTSSLAWQTGSVNKIGHTMIRRLHNNGVTRLRQRDFDQFLSG